MGNKALRGLMKRLRLLFYYCVELFSSHLNKFLSRYFEISSKYWIEGAIRPNGRQAFSVLKLYEGNYHNSY